MDRDDTARVLGLPPERVRIMPSATGGGFGSKLDLSVQPLIGLAALKTGPAGAHGLHAAAKSMAVDHQAPPGADDARGSAAMPTGGSPALDFDGDFNTGAYASWGPTVANRVPVHASGPYRDAALPAPRRGRSTPTARSRAPSAASACRRRRSRRKRSMTIWRRSPASTGWSSAGSTPWATATGRSAGSSFAASASAPASRRCRPVAGGAGRGRGGQRGRERHPARRRHRLLLVWLRQHRAAQPLDHPASGLTPRRAAASCIRARSISARGRTR